MQPAAIGSGGEAWPFRSRSVLRHEAVLGFLLVVVMFLLAQQSDKLLPDGQHPQPGPADDGDRPDRAADDASSSSPAASISPSARSSASVAILLGVFWQNLRHPLPFAMVAGRAGRRRRRSRQRPHHHPLQGAAADRDAGDARLLSRPCRGHQPGALGARLSGMVLRARPEGCAGAYRRSSRILILLSIIAAGILGLTTFGRATYAIGASETAARFSGINVDRTKLMIYTASGLVSGLAAVIFVSRVSTTRSDMGTGVELDVITAVVLGGTSIFGGRGTIIGTVIGLILVQALKNGLSLSGVKGDGTIVVIGLVLIFAILASNLFSRNGDG